MSHVDLELEALVDGTLEEGARLSALAHIEGCADCRRQYAAAAAIPRLLGPDSDPPAPAGLADEVVRKARHRRRRRGAPAHLLLAAAVAAGLTLAGAAAGLAGSYQPTLLRPPALVAAEPPAPATAPVAEAETSAQVPAPIQAPAASPHEGPAVEPDQTLVTPPPSQPAQRKDPTPHSPKATAHPVRSPTPLPLDLGPLSSSNDDLTGSSTVDVNSDPEQGKAAEDEAAQPTEPTPATHPTPATQPTPGTRSVRPRRPPASAPCLAACD